MHAYSFLFASLGGYTIFNDLLDFYKHDISVWNLIIKKFEIKHIISTVVSFIIFIISIVCLVLNFRLSYTKNYLMLFLTVIVTELIFLFIIGKCINAVLKNRYNKEISKFSVIAEWGKLDEIRIEHLIRFLNKANLNSPEKIKVLISVLQQKKDEFKFKGLFSAGIFFTGILTLWANYVSFRLKDIKSQDITNTIAELVAILITIVIYIEGTKMFFDFYVVSLVERNSKACKKLIELLNICLLKCRM